MKRLPLVAFFAFNTARYHVAAQESTCMLTLLSCGGFSSDDCVEQYCKYECSQRCCGLSSLDAIRTCLAGSSTNTASADPNGVACGTAINIISSCQTAVPSFTAAPDSVVQSCLCHDSDGTLDPQPFDNGISACSVYFATAEVSLMPVVSQYLGLCTRNLASSSTSSPVSNQASPLSTSNMAAKTASATNSGSASSTPESTVAANPSGSGSPVLISVQFESLVLLSLAVVCLGIF